MLVFRLGVLATFARLGVSRLFAVKRLAGLGAPDRRTRARGVSPRCGIVAAAVVCSLFSISGCEDHSDAARKIRMAESRRNAASDVGVNHLAEALSLVDRLVSLNAKAARRQIKFQLGQWANEAEWEAGELPSVFNDVRDTVPIEQLWDRFANARFGDRDIDRLRDASLYRDLVTWVDRDDSASTDPVLDGWFSELAQSPDSNQQRAAQQLATASRLFDWMTRNVAPQALVPPLPVEPPELPAGLQYMGAGYRQSPFETLFRGSGDWYSRAIVFCGLCRQVNLSAAIIATAGDGGQVLPWCVGVLVDGEIYLLDFELGIHVPGPGSVGIATLRQARTDESILRRMNVTGFFDYRLGKSDVQSCLALIPVTPEDTAPRMLTLQNALTGDYRMKVHVDIEDLVERLDAASGVADVRVWDVPLKIEAYHDAINRAADRDPRLAFIERGPWMMLEADVPTSKQLAIGRLQQLRGNFNDDSVEDRLGARSLLLAQRQPEFEIEDLRTDPELQIKYDVRRMLGVGEKDYDRQIQFAQQLIRAAKRTATYWIASLQYDDKMYANAKQWYVQRVLDEDQAFIWTTPARYSLARTYEKMGEIDEAIEIYKTRGLPNEHGHRLRARLLQATQ